MPEYLAPAVYVEETSFRAKSIEGVSTSTTGFVGPTRKGPTIGTPELITSFGDFERIYGGFQNLQFAGGAAINYIANGVKNYFDNGGARLFVARVDSAGVSAATAFIGGGGDNADNIRFVARSAGQVGNGTVTTGLVSVEATPQGMRRAPSGTILADNGTLYVKRGADWVEDDDTVFIFNIATNSWADDGATEIPVGNATAAAVAAAEAAGDAADVAAAAAVVAAAAAAADPADPALETAATDAANAADAAATAATVADAAADAATPVLSTVNILLVDGDDNETFYENLGIATGHPRYVGDVLAINPGRRIDQLENTFAVEIGANVDGFRLHAILTANTAVVPLVGGTDGAEPVAAGYTAPLAALAVVEDISIVAAPGYSSFIDATREGIQDALITHAETRRAYRIAVLDTPAAQTVVTSLAVKSRIDSSYAALYHPWVFGSNPLSQPGNESIPREIMQPPSSYICGIYARNDNTKGVSKSPGNERVAGAMRFETDISFAEQEVLNPRGVNCLRFFPGRGNRLWGARTTSSDPEWKYVGPRRYFLYLEHSIDRSTQWSVFENNGPELWANVRESVTSFLYNEWVSGALLGANTEEAYFVRCDRTTMTQNDLDNGRLICLVGVSVLKPAEFVVFRIGQKTADSRS